MHGVCWVNDVCAHLRACVPAGYGLMMLAAPAAAAADDEDDDEDTGAGRPAGVCCRGCRRCAAAAPRFTSVAALRPPLAAPAGDARPPSTSAACPSPLSIGHVPVSCTRRQASRRRQAGLHRRASKAAATVHRPSAQAKRSLQATAHLRQRVARGHRRDGHDGVLNRLPNEHRARLDDRCSNTGQASDGSGAPLERAATRPVQAVREQHGRGRRRPHRAAVCEYAGGRPQRVQRDLPGAAGQPQPADDARDAVTCSGQTALGMQWRGSSLSTR